MSKPIQVLVWDEKPSHASKEIYPNSINGAVADGLRSLGGAEIAVTTVNLEDPEQGVRREDLEASDVLIWWGHQRHDEVSDETVSRVVDAVHHRGLGFIALHSAHYARTFKAVVQGTGQLRGGWREMDPPEREEITVCAPWHPIAEGIGNFVLEHEEMYGAPFDVPPPLTTVFHSHFPYDGKNFPSGLTWTVGDGKTPGFECGPGQGIGEGFGVGRVFYFRPGHETIPTYNNPIIRKILWNAVRWCAKRT
jgi:trehalose utilization protein